MDRRHLRVLGQDPLDAFLRLQGELAHGLAVSAVHARSQLLVRGWVDVCCGVLVDRRLAEAS